jgi:phosphoserine aminotransferase
MSRTYNFSAGPAVLPDEVLARIRDDIPDWHRGMSVMEVSHRSKEFIAVAQKAEQDVRELLAIPADYYVLFLQGGATMQFAMTPLNLSRQDDAVDYVQTGSWSKKAVAEAWKFCHVSVVADSQDENFTYIPDEKGWNRNPGAAYLHYCPNETIHGVEFHFVPDTGDVPLVADMSSTILSRPVDVSKFGVIYAGAQKNVGPAGLTLVIVRKDLTGRARSGIPSLLAWAEYASTASMTNTPPTFAWYAAGLVFEYLKENGGLEAMAERNARKACELYEAIDASSFYSNPEREDCRSWMNVPFLLADSALDGRFLAGADAAGLLNLKGHRSVGGMRASLYNAMSEAGVDALVDFMRDFERRKV